MIYYTYSCLIEKNEFFCFINVTFCISDLYLLMSKIKQLKGVHFFLSSDLLTDDEIINKYINLVYAFAFVNLKNKSDAEDITQEVFLRYIKVSSKLKSEEHRKNWLLKTTSNLCINFHKSAWKRYVSFFNEKNENLLIHDNDIEDKVSFKDALMKLSPKYLSVIHLYYYEDMTVEQISQTLGIKNSAVKMRLKRAKENLRKIIEEDGEVFED